MRVTLGIDGGGSKTEVALLGPDGNLLSLCRSGPANCNYVSIEQRRSNLEDALKEAMKEGGVEPENIDRVGVCLAFPVYEEKEALGDYAPLARVYRMHEADVTLAQCGWFKRVGVVAVSGTGSNFMVFRDGQSATFGGFGSILGDEGSGFDLSLRGIKAALRAIPEDGRNPPTALTHRLWRHFEISSRREMVKISIQFPLNRTAIATFARQVVEAADEGDWVAIRLCEEIAISLSEDIVHAGNQFFGTEDSFPVAMGGGLLQGARVISKSVEQRVQSRFGRAEIRVASIPAAVGAAQAAIAMEQPVQ